MDFGKLIEAGMTDANGGTTILTGALPFAPLRIPWYIALAGDALFWSDNASRITTASDKGALNAFIKIKTEDDILHFARRYGPLGLCEHGLPPMHERDDGERHWCPPYKEDDKLRWGKEPLKRWYDYVEVAKKLLSATADWNISPSAELGAGLHKFAFRFFVADWLSSAGIRLDLQWNQGKYNLVLTGGGVFGALGVQLLSAVTTNNLTICSGCGKLYLREGRKPQEGRRNFCPKCGDTVASKLRVRDTRIRKKEEKNERVNKTKR